ncbi:MAG TPA: protein kinase [Pyrinomonadaceae bacterium]|jgi:Tol biopolymer transport system component
MAIEAGTRFGRYEIQSLLGAGGMGEVYRALDTELNRPVALKFLPAEFALHQSRMKRFIQEARAASALNHPNIITVYEIGRIGEEENSAPFFATEFIDGVTLRQYVSSRRMKLGEVLDIATQIASALVAAHAAGIVHRDIKPENVMVRTDGYVKVLDFGLAKPTERQSSSVDSEAETRALVNTDPGSVMGTVSYMSPEQARGLQVDARTDIWSLGCVLYEMIAGHLPFTGATPSHVIVSLLEDEPPPLANYVQGVPEAVEWIVAEALTKDREERTQTAKEILGKLRRLKQRIDAGTELERSVAPHLPSGSTAAAQGFRSQGTQSTAERQGRTTVRFGEVGAGDVGAAATASSAQYLASRIKRHRTGALLALVFGLIAAAGLAFGIYKWTARSKPLALAPPMKVTRLTSTGKAFGPAISPDGKYIAHIVKEGNRQSLLLRQTATTSSREIVAPTDGYFLETAFAPDGNYLYYVLGEKGKGVRALYQVSVLGGAARQLIYDIDSRITFSPDAKKIAFLRGYLKEREKALFIANADGTGEERVISVKFPQDLIDPAWSPDGKVIAFARYGTDQEGYFVNVEEVRLADKAQRKISAERWRSLSSISWLPDGSGMVAVARDRASIAGSPMQIWQLSYPNGEARRITNDWNYYTGVSLSADSRTLVAGMETHTSNIWVAPGAETKGARPVTSNSFAGLEGLAWTPDGRIVYTSMERDNRDLWMMNADGSGQKQLSFETSADLSPCVSPDGRYIIFQSNRGVGWGIWRVNADGGSPVELVKNIGESAWPQCSPDSRSVVYAANADGKESLWRVPIEGGAPVQVQERQTFGHALSPDGKFIAYYHREPEVAARLQIEVIPAEGGAPVKTLDAPTDGGLLRWSPDSRALNYIDTRDGVSNLWSLPLETGQPKQLTDWKSDFIFRFAWSSDGKQLAFARGVSMTDLVLMEGLDLLAQ